MDHLKPKVEIDPSAGFCSGVRRAIEVAEQLLSQPGGVACLGEIVHNESELSRLRHLGLKILDHGVDSGFAPGNKVIIRAHGEPPATFERLKSVGAGVYDATCPVVIKLQQKVSIASAAMKENGGTVVIFGKPGHPEVTGLLGYSSGNVVVVSGQDDLELVDLSKPLRIFSQTTSDLEAYRKFCDTIQSGAEKVSGSTPDVIIYQTVCGQVSRRKPDIERFASSHDVIVFVSGSESSNGKYLSGISKRCNPRTFVVTGTGQIKPGWFEEISSVGVSGATSTPVWLMQQVAAEITEMIKKN